MRTRVAHRPTLTKMEHGFPPRIATLKEKKTYKNGFVSEEKSCFEDTSRSSKQRPPEILRHDRVPMRSCHRKDARGLPASFLRENDPKPNKVCDPFRFPPSTVGPLDSIWPRA